MVEARRSWLSFAVEILPNNSPKSCGCISSLHLRSVKEKNVIFLHQTTCYTMGDKSHPYPTQTVGKVGKVGAEVKLEVLKQPETN